MEFCENGSLKDYMIAQNGKLLLTKDGSTHVNPIIIKWAMNIASGMGFLNENKVHVLILFAEMLILILCVYCLY